MLDRRLETLVSRVQAAVEGGRTKDVLAGAADLLKALGVDNVLKKEATRKVAKALGCRPEDVDLDDLHRLDDGSKRTMVRAGVLSMLKNLPVGVAATETGRAAERAMSDGLAGRAGLLDVTDGRARVKRNRSIPTEKAAAVAQRAGAIMRQGIYLGPRWGFEHIGGRDRAFGLAGFEHGIFNRKAVIALRDRSYRDEAVREAFARGRRGDGNLCM